MEILDGTLVDILVIRDTGVVDDDVDLEFPRGRVHVCASFGPAKLLVCEGDDCCGSGGGAHVGLYVESGDIVRFLETGSEGCGSFGRGGGVVVEDQITSFCGEVFGDGFADAWLLRNIVFC